MAPAKKDMGPDPDPTQYLFVSLEMKRQDQTKPYDGKKATWVPCDKDSYQLGEIVGTKGDLVVVKVADGEKTFKKDQCSQVNPPKYEKCEDMSNLTYLNDASVLWNLKARYTNQLIYTYSGLFCVAINPYKRFPIYTQRVIKMYIGKRRNEVPPHIFCISDGAYMDMLTNHENQSMLITGESGAGKTENTKKVIAYMASVGASTKKPKEGEAKKGNLEDQIVQTNPVLEAFGNAKTTRNDNSSRFGKFIRIHFGNSGKLAGADIETYLLEKARVISQQALERSYHIFYQIMSGRLPTLKAMCSLSDNIYDYPFVSQGKVTVPSIDDSEEMQMADEAFDILGFTQDEKDMIYKVVGAVMHLGTMKFKQRGREEQAEQEGKEERYTELVAILFLEGENVAKMMGVDGPQLYMNFLKPRIKVGNEFVTQGRNVNQVVYSIGAMAKAIFDRLFKWLVKRVNETLETGQKRVTFIGVLDIAGFEIFDPMGVLSILEEESMFPKATDQTFAEKLNNNHLGKSASFVKPKPAKAGCKEAHFAIAHYAGTVPYNITGWLEKNKDPLNDTVVDQFKKGNNKLVQEIFADHPGQSGGKEEAKAIRQVFFKAGVLGQLEEMRDDKLAKIITWLQSAIRGYHTRKQYKQLQDQRVALCVVQRNLRSYLQMRTWAWYRLWQKVKPLLNVTRVEDEIKALEDKAAAAQANFEKEEKLRKELETNLAKLNKEKEDLLNRLQAESGTVADFHEKQNKLMSQKADLESQLSDTQERLQQEEDARNQLFQNKKKLEQEASGLKKDIEDLELALQKTETDKATKDHQIRNLNDEIAHQDELINKLNKEKKHMQEVNQKTAEDLQASEDKVNHLNKVKAKLEQTLDELEDSLEREKKLRADIEKNKRKTEGDLKLTQEAVADLERNKKELEQTIQRKDKEIASLNAKLEDEQSLVGKLQKQIKELQSRIEELEEEVEAERQARAKAEKQRADLARELEELGERLEEAGGATAAQIELNKKREAELSKLRRDLEESNIQHESVLSNLRKKHNDAVSEMSEQIDQLNKMKAKAEKDRSQFAGENNDLRAAMDHVSSDKAAAEKMTKMLQQQLNEVQSKLDEANRSLNDFDVQKKKLTIENSDYLRQLEDAESQVSQLQKLKISLTTQLEDSKRMADEEGRERATLLGKFRNLEHDIDNIREQLDEESEAKADLQRQLSKSNADCQMWRHKYESEGVAKAEELEDAKRKLQARLGEAEEAIESLNQKNVALEKIKMRLTGELDDMHVEVERATVLANQMEKRGKNFDKVVSEWKAKVDDLAAELDASQKECRNYSTELFRLKAGYDESQEHLEAVRRENKNLADEIKDLMDQIGEGGRNVHEIDKQRKRLEVEKEELQAALEEAESALEQEENKVLRAQLELSQVRQEIDRRIQEKEEEFENTRKNHQRAIDSMQASLEAEAKGKAEALRMKKKLESDINELEIALDHANKANAEAQKSIKRYQQNMKETQAALEEEQRNRDDLREQYGIAERRANALQGELEESRTLLEQADRARRQAETELADAHEQLHDLTAQAASSTAAKRKMESELQTLHADLDDMINETKNSEEKAKKAMVDAARLADELRAEQEHAQTQEKQRKALELQVKELQVRLDESENNALKGGKKAIQKLEERVRGLETELDGEQRRHADAQKNLRKSERRIKELTFQSDEDRKNHERMQDLVDKLQQKIKTYKRQIEEAEEIAALNLAKFRKAQQELEEADERAELADQAVSKLRAKGRGGSASRLSPPPQMKPRSKRDFE
ncbi:Myosin heavy chain [Daphnia magna]|uniref:Myosin heavy chain n=1 Tax=Daphnia magna TaxID=35525 RepID=A0A162DGC9_9CRUS|nr:Myosin heavy chain [Daphnia magna]